MAAALRSAAPAILASGSTVALGLLALLADEHQLDARSRPGRTIGIACALAQSSGRWPSCSATSMIHRPAASSRLAFVCRHADGCVNPSPCFLASGV